MNFPRSLERTSKLRSVRSSELSRDYKRRLARERTLISFSIEFTYRCNLRCAHCYCPPGDRAAELSTDEIRQVLDDAAAMGSLFALITGGEPLLRRDFAVLYRHAKQLGMLVTVFTNGTLIDEQIAELWDEWPPSLVEISLYGLTREVYEGVVAVEGSYDRCLAGIQRVLAAGHPLALKCPVTTKNAHEIPVLSDFAKDLGVEFRYDPVILATVEGGRTPHQLRLSAEEIVALERRDVERDRAWREYLADGARPEAASDALFSCGAGRNSLHIDPYGNVQVCLMVKRFAQSLREKGLKAIHQRHFPRVLSLRRERDSRCGSCLERSACNNCPGVALWEIGNHLSHVAFQCELASARHRVFRRAAPGGATGEIHPGSGGPGRTGGCGGAALEAGGAS